LRLHGSLSLALAFAGCAGQIALPDGARDLKGSDWPSQQDSPYADLYPPTEGGLSDGSIADLALPADLAPIDAGPPTGGPCPCTAPLLCFNNACRATCTPPTDPCQAIASCPPDHGCLILTSPAGMAVCVPAAAAGQPCSTTVGCVVNTSCISVNNGPYLCLPTCSQKGASCGSSGGTCLDVNGCLACSSP